jgi:hypothetical protein
MKNKYTKETNESLLAILLETANWPDYEPCQRNHERARQEILRRMACYQFAVKPLNKKLYGKIRIQL